MRRIIIFLTLSFICLLLGLAVYSRYNFSTFKVSDITSSYPYREDWEAKTIGINDLSSLFAKPLTYLGEGGQSYAFASADDRYVLKFFKFNRFRPSLFFQLLPKFAPFSSYFQSHAAKRERKLETAFAGYKLAFEQLREESGLKTIQLNALASPLYAAIKNQQGEDLSINLQNIPFVVQQKGEMLSETIKRQLDKGDLESCKTTIDQLFTLFRVEHAKGITDLDRGIMHNIGCIDGKRLFHLDPGKLVYNEEIKKPENSHRELCIAASKVDSWIKKNFKEYAEPLNQHLQAQFKDSLWIPAKKTKSDLPECENLFSSNLYTEYRRQLYTFIQGHPLYSSVKEESSPIDRQVQPPGPLRGIDENDGEYEEEPV